MPATVVEAARFLGVPEVSADGTETITGHTLRVTGAQGLSRYGLDLWAVQLYGRWGSEAVKAYVRLVPLEQAARKAAVAARAQAHPEAVLAADRVAHKAVSAAPSNELSAVVAEVGSESIGPVEALRVAVAAALPEWVSAVESLAEPLAVELETASPLPASVTWVRNSSRHGCRGIFHVLSAVSKDFGRGEPKSRCGWRFGRVNTAVAKCEPPPPAEFFRVCKRCAPSARRALFKSFAACLGGA